LCNAKEYDSALLLLRNIGMKVTNRVGEHFLTPEKVDDSKVMQDNLYSFNYRRMQAQYHIYFQDFKSAEDQLRNLFSDELKFYDMLIEKPNEEVTPPPKEEPKEETQILN
jgi:hypothetical protein